MTKTHFTNLDILRGFAALLVLFDHGFSRGLWPGFLTGQTGVGIFFSLSGFLMGYLYSSKRFILTNVIKYIVSRFARIAPAYLTIIGLSYVVYTSVDSNYVYHISNENILRHLLFSGNFAVFWTIPPEVQFYAFFILIWFAIQIAIKGNLLPITLLLLLAVVLIYFGESFPGTTLPFTLHFFLFGCVAGYVRRELAPVFKQTHFIQLVTLIITIVTGIYLRFSGQYTDFDFYRNISYALLCALTVWLLSLSDYTFNNAVVQQFLISIGKCSFSLYLLHEIILHYYQFANFGLSGAVNLLICFCLSIIVSYSFYRYYESPVNVKLKGLLLTLLNKQQ